MASFVNIHNIDSETFSEKIDINELFEKKRTADLQNHELFNKILHRAHVKIKMVKKDTFCWFTVPEVIFGTPKYDHVKCIAYVMDRLVANKFMVKFFYPNILLINWTKYVPEYVRNEIKHKMGIVLNEFGEEQKEPNGSNNINTNTFVDNMNTNMNILDAATASNATTAATANDAPKRKYASVKSYTPSRNMIYDENIMRQIEARTHNK